MNTSFALERAGGRQELAELLGVASITTYHWPLDQPLPKKHLRFIMAARPDWAGAWDREQRKQRKAKP